MKCKDIPDVDVLRFLAKHQGEWSTWGDAPASWPSVQRAMPPGTPEKLQLAKMRRLMARGLSGGCGCGCRGDFEITDKGLALINEPRTKPYSGY